MPSAVNCRSGIILRKENVNGWSNRNGRAGHPSASTVGNQGAVASSKAAALAAAEEFVGPGARPIYKAGEVIGKISADGTKVYRITSISKAQPYVNLVNKATGGNLHVRF